MKNREKIKNLAKKKARKLQKLRTDPRYKRVLGRLAYEGWIDTTVPEMRVRFTVDEALWVGENIEPRVLELLPAIAIKRPSLLATDNMPNDLKETIHMLKRGETDLEFRGMPLKKCAEWLPHVGRKGVLPSAVKSFRLSQEEQEILQTLSASKKISESEVIRMALQRLDQS